MCKKKKKRFNILQWAATCRYNLKKSWLIHIKSTNKRRNTVNPQGSPSHESKITQLYKTWSEDSPWKKSTQHRPLCACSQLKHYHHHYHPLVLVARSQIHHRTGLLFLVASWHKVAVFFFSPRGADAWGIPSSHIFLGNDWPSTKSLAAAS